MSRELLQQALDALDYLGDSSDYHVSPDAWEKAKAEAACTALREALAQPQAEPVALCDALRWSGAKESHGVMMFSPNQLRKFYEFASRAAPPAAPAPAVPEGDVVVSWNEDGQIIAVTRQDDEGRILSVIAEAAQPAVAVGMKSSEWKTLSPEAQALIYQTGQRAVDRVREQRKLDGAARAAMPLVPLGAAQPAGMVLVPRDAQAIKNALCIDGTLNRALDDILSSGGIGNVDAIFNILGALAHEAVDRALAASPTQPAAKPLTTSSVVRQESGNVTDKVVPLAQKRHDLQRLVDDIKAVVHERVGAISVTEALGALEIAKLEIFREQS